LKVGPLPGQSSLAVQPHPWLPNTYTVPFLDGHLVYGVPPNKSLIIVLARSPRWRHKPGEIGVIVTR
jgi:hypothetical protein